jgi:hypothetical protein
MSSNIDITKPVEGNATTQSVRDNFSHAKTEIEALQLAVGNNSSSDLVSDLTPQLGGILDANGFDIDMGDNVITDAKVADWDASFSYGDHSTQGYLTSVSESDVTQHEAALSLTESQISDLQAYLTTVSESDVTQHEAALSLTESQISDLQAYLTTVSESDVTQHEAALSIVESQITFTTDLVEEAPASGLVYGRANGAWVEVTGGGSGGSGTAGGPNLKYDAITPDGSATYDLEIASVAQTPIGATNLMVSVNGVIQEPGVDFTVSGSQITFTTALTAAEHNVNFIVEMTNGSYWEQSGVNLEYNGTGTKVITHNLDVEGAFTSLGIDDNATSTAITIASSGLVNLSGSIEATTAYRAYDSVGAAYRNVLRYSAGDVRLETGSSGTESIGLWTASQERMRIAASGNVGIGETNPTSALTVSGDIELTGGPKTIKNGSGFLQVGTTSADHLAFLTNSSERMRIDSSGNVGIGSDTPVYPLTVGDGTDALETINIISTDASQSRIFFSDASNNGQGRLTYDHSDDSLQVFTNDTEKMRIDAGGNLNVGDTTWYAAAANRRHLHLKGGTDGSFLALSTSGSGDSYLECDNSGRFNVWNRADGDMVFGTNNVERMRIDNTGRVGIGYSLPDAVLHVAETSSGLTARFTNSINQTLDMGTVSGSGAAGSVYFDNPNSGNMQFRIGNTEKMRIDSVGNVGIGTDSPSSKLSVLGNTSNYGILATQPSGYAGFNIKSTTVNQTWSLIAQDNGGNSDLLLYGGSSAGTKLTVNHSGFLMVGTSTPVSGYSHLFQSGANDVTFRAYRPATGASSSVAVFASDVGGIGTAVCAVRVDGDLENINNSYGGLSDARLKSNIVDASPQLDDIMAVKVRSYTLDSTGDTHIGVVAQELEEAGMHGLVNENEDGMKSVKYSVLYMKAIKAIQEQQQLIESLQQRLTDGGL